MAETCARVTTTDFGHGRIEERRCLATDDISWLRSLHPDWVNLRSVAAIIASRTDKVTGETSEEMRCYISSLPANPAVLLNATRSHWSIENNLHWVMDVTFHDDLSRARDKNAVAALDSVPGTLWTNGSDSSNGKNDRVAEPIAKKLERSFYLIRPSGFSTQVSTEGNERKIRGNFTLNTIPYNCVVTDPIMEKRFTKQRDGTYPLSNAMLCVSLGELYFGYAYKLVAAVLMPEKKKGPSFCK